MVLYTIDAQRRIKKACDTYTSVIWTTSYAGMGDFVMTCPATADTVATFCRGARLARDVDIMDDRIASQMIIWDIKTSYDQDHGWMLTAYGKQLKSILRQRVIGSYITSSGLIEEAVRRAVSDNVISPDNPLRVYAGLDLGPLLGIQDEQDIQVTPGQNLGDWVEGMCKAIGLGWDVYTDRADGRDKFCLTQGTDRSTAQDANPTVILSPDNDSISAVSISTITGSYGDAALVTGEGEGSDQASIYVGTSADRDRHEVHIDGSSVTSDGAIITPAQYLRLLKTYGQTELARHSLVQQIDAVVSEDGIYKYGTSYTLGDIVDISGEYIPLSRCRITECTEAYDTDGETRIITSDAMSA